MKKLIIIIIVFTFAFLFAPGIYAEEKSYSDEKAEEISQIDIPDGAEKFISENEITVSEPEGIMSLSPMTVLEYIWDGLLDAFAAPLKMLAAIFTVILISSLLEGTGSALAKDGLVKTYRIISVLACVGIATGYISESVDYAVRTIEAGGNFMLCYVPAFSGIAAAGGGVSSATSYNIIVMCAAELFVAISSNILMPMMSLCLCLGVVEAISPAVSLSGFTEAVNKLVKMSIGFISTVFAGLLTIQSIVGTSADTLSIKAGKYMVSNLVPVVGSAVSDAYVTLRSSLGVLRGGTGTFGIIVLFLTVMPPILSVAATRACIFIGQTAADVFSVKAVSAFLKNAGTVLSMTLAVTVCFAMMFIVSTTIVMMIGMDVC